MSFKEVIQEFEAWICGHNLWEKERGGPLTSAAFVTWWVLLLAYMEYMFSDFLLGFNVETFIIEWFCGMWLAQPLNLVNICSIYHFGYV